MAAGFKYLNYFQIFEPNLAIVCLKLARENLILAKLLPFGFSYFFWDQKIQLAQVSKSLTRAQPPLFSKF